MTQPILSSDPDWTRVFQARERLVELHDAIAAYQETRSPFPESNSKGSEDVIFCKDEELALTVHSPAGRLAESAADHVMLFTKAITNPGQPLACWTCVRGALEAGALACWLISPDLTSNERMARAFALRFDGVCEQVKFGLALSDKEVVDRGRRRKGEITRQAASLGIAPIFDRNKKQIGVGARLPGPTELVERFLSDGAYYRLLSAVAHGQDWAMWQVGFKKVPFGERAVTVKDLNSAWGANLLVLCLRAMTHPVWLRARLFGWPLGELKDILERGCNDIGVIRDLRYRPWMSLLG